MLGGLHLDTIHVSTNLFVRLFQRFCGRMPVGVDGTRPKTQAGSKPALVSATGSRKLSPILVASFEMPAANAGGTTFNLKVPGSIPGRAFAGTVAQLVERQTPVRGCCFSNPCRRSSEQYVWCMRTVRDGGGSSSLACESRCGNEVCDAYRGRLQEWS